MAPKTNKDMLPKTIAEFTLLMDAKGLEITAANMDSNKALGALKHQLKSQFGDLVGQYEELDSNRHRYGWLCDYIADPKTGGKATGTNYTQRTTKHTDKLAIIWLTEHQLASSRWLNRF